MGAVQNNGARYERTKDVSKMLTSGQLAAAIISAVRKEFERQTPDSNIFEVLPARVATSMEYKAGQTKAQIGNRDEKKVTIDLPLQDGWYLSDGNPFGVPNGKKSTRADPDALYLYRHQNSDFSGPVGLGYDVGFIFDVARRRNFVACDLWSYDSGVALINATEVRAPQNLTGTTPFRTPPGLTIPSELAIELRSLHGTSQEEVAELADALKLLKPGVSLEATSRVLAILEEVLKA